MESVCVKCSQELGSRFYADVPNVGDLCLPCHAAWFRDLSATQAEYRRRSPDGDGELKEYVVWKEELHITEYFVEATTPEEAREIVKEGGGEAGDSEFAGELNADDWKVHAVNESKGEADGS